MVSTSEEMLGLAEHRVGGNAGCFEGFTHTLKCVDRLEVEDELLEDVGNHQFILRNIDLPTSCCGLTSSIAQGYLRRKEIQRIVCSQCLFLAGFLPRIFEHLTDVDRNSKSMALNGPLIGIIGAGGQLGSAITQTFLDFGWKPFRLAVCGRGASKLKRFEALGVCVFDDASLLVRAVRMVVVAVGPQHVRQVGANLGDAGTGSRLVLSTLAGISEASLERVLGTQHLLQIRVDVARLDVVESMARHGGDAASPGIPGKTGKSGSRRAGGGDSDHELVAPAEGGSSRESLEACRAVHERAARQLVTDRGAAERVLCRLESFLVAQGLSAALAHEASRDWLPAAAQSETTEAPAQSGVAEDRAAGGNDPSAAHPSGCCPTDDSFSEGTGEDHQGETRQKRSVGPPPSPPLPAIAPAAAAVATLAAGRGPPLPSRARAEPPEGSRVQGGQQPAADGGPSLLAARRISPAAAPNSSASQGAAGFGEGSTDSGEAGGGEDQCGEGGGARQERLATAASLRSARSVESRGRSPRQQQQQLLLTGRRAKHRAGRDPDEGWIPRSTWPPPDLAVIDDLYQEVLHIPYGDAVLSSGYPDGHVSSMPAGS